MNNDIQGDMKVSNWKREQKENNKLICYYTLVHKLSGNSKEMHANVTYSETRTVGFTNP
ncbi:uncharacterized protein CANTADRAFT_24953 [Suhomyces tanzawaensis NRRL Y-17324]|uniref:Uncharacterized protein n=1 Tax=Suhomyces tanzawaensis NRRL Y-17324 TaxID=984487 RepID=A0A1E4SSF3_9ASCO|nr:uncharacterized protein CANTADRAFT_24953 [Suhomyces tanzawaensis NRRL Y-17324]ODV82446.1 hypothetical protein CANTADRAFT_24953 [Suhomyces tanzawaensis NRRL Y-17324]